MIEFFKKAWMVLKRGSLSFFQEDAFTYAASIAYYTIFSMPAVLLIAVSVGAAFYEENKVQMELTNQISALIGSTSAAEIEKMLEKVAIESSSNSLAKTLGIVALIVSSTTVFISLQLSINRVWNVKAKPKRGVVKYIINRLLSLAMVISIGFIMLVSLLLESLLVILHDFLMANLGGVSVYVVSVFSFIVSLGIVSLIFALMFKILPDAKIDWKDVWVGSLITAILFSLGKYLIGIYLGSSSITTAYGAAGSVVVVLAWVYYAAIIFLFGAKLTYSYAEIFNSKIEPKSNAVRVKTVEIETDE
ncbi:YihY/virulence factor BrkB family protein [Imperialibacter roseus]|uniref:YihY/virulence factor BrkB family protein n=1 Tax=Imperialibacter roseus TaxID=1324217 RepID=A0ABZ0INV6_9BACT|nr:YihY/virulence factor BrkB family protein [Imperialibacter roseus]WOK06035.1 YihY/virulence factor BrkB family protein [Imperialibacter roseus]|tara:strand:- start:114524 stop:115435 length:912 start_codon:yes stop_codon:yes gene_type:complete